MGQSREKPCVHVVPLMRVGCCSKNYAIAVICFWFFFGWAVVQWGGVAFSVELSIQDSTSEGHPYAAHGEQQQQHARGVPPPPPASRESNAGVQQAGPVGGVAWPSCLPMGWLGMHVMLFMVWHAARHSAAVVFETESVSIHRWDSCWFRQQSPEGMRPSCTVLRTIFVGFDVGGNLFWHRLSLHSAW